MNKQVKCRARVEEAFKMAEAHYNTTIPRVPVKFTNSMTRCAGTAHYKRLFSGKLHGTEIRLANKLLNLNGDDFIARTPGHEAAHIIAAHLFQETGHGTKWQEVMAVIGQKAERLHNMATVKRVLKKFRYVATCGTEVELSAQRHRNIQMKGAEYFLKRTGGELNSACFAPKSTPRKITEVTKARPVNKMRGKGTSKAAMLRDAARPMKEKGVSLEEILANETIVAMISKCCGLPEGNVRSGLRFHWSKI